MSYAETLLPEFDHEMANTRKVTVTLPIEQVQAISDLVAANRAGSVSGFVQHAVGNALDDIAGWGAMLAAALHDTGGELTSVERQWADEILSGRAGHGDAA